MIDRSSINVWRRAMWRHPEWWGLVLSACAWILMILDSVGHSATRGHELTHGAAVDTPIAEMWLHEFARWLLMIVAMMVPLTIGPIRTTGARSLWRRRHRAIAAFLAGYLLPWTVVGMLAATFIVSAPPDTRRELPLGVACALAIAAAWQIVPAKRRALVSCHRAEPIAPAGWRATRDCLRYGWTIGASCVASCFALMLVCIVAGHSVMAMAVVAIVGTSERLTPMANQSVTSAALAALSFFVMVYRLGG